jgi:outer membrane PBP1 activator LpoA protein
MGKRLRRDLRTATTVVLLLMLGACATAPKPPPASTGRTPDIAPTITPDTSAPAPEAIIDPLLEPVRDALARGDWVAAALALPKPTGAEADPNTGAWLQYYQARIAMLRGDKDGAAALMASLNTASAPEALRRELLLSALRSARLSGDRRQAADSALALYRMGGHSEFSAGDSEQALWSAVQGISAPVSRETGWHSWWALAQAARLDDGADAAVAIAQWLTANADHPAVARARSIERASLADAALARPAILVPMSGPLARAGNAVASGTLAAYYAHNQANPQRPQQIFLIDSRRYNRMEDAYAAVLAEQSDLLIGPLGKLQVSQLLGAGFSDIPLLTLNRPDPLVAATSMSLQLSLAPEDEAALIARRAFAAGGRSALLVRPEGEWGDRMEAALLADWRDVGGLLQSRAVFSQPSGYSSALQAALKLDASTIRQRDIRKLFTDPVESVGRRRADIDVIFLLTRNAEEARALKPLINYHYAGDLPVYALSTADDGGAGSRDLNGLRLPVMPWRLGALPPGIAEGESAAASAPLHALGVDAWALGQRAYRLASGTGLEHGGYTGQLRVGPNNTLVRELPMAEFSRGQLRPL